MRKLLFFISIIFLADSLFAQDINHIVDSILKQTIGATKEKTAHEYLIVGANTRNINTDTAFHYDKIGLKMAIDLKNDSLLLSAYNNIALDYKQLGNFEIAEKYFKKSMEYAFKTNDSIQISSAYNNLGVLLSDQGKYNQALEYFIKSIEIDETMQDKESMAISYNNIGMIHYSMGDYERALNYYEKGLKIKKELNDKDGIALLNMNIGIIYYFKDDYEKVLSYFKIALKLWEELQNPRRIALVKSNIGELYYELELFPEAIKYLNEAKKIYTDLNEVFDVIQTDLLIGDIYTNKKDFANAISIYDLALKHAKNANSIAEEILVYDSYKKMYIIKKDYKNAYKYFEKYQLLKDSIYNQEKSNKIEELETKYQSEKKERKIDLMKKDKMLGDLIQKKMLITIYSISIGVLLLFILIFYVLRAYRIKKQAYIKINKQKDEINLKNSELNQSNEEITAQRDEIERQRDYANEQRDLIFIQKEAITDSILYAKRIQKAIIPRDNEIKLILKDYFIFYLPKDVVSGDFYWVSKINKFTIISVADCTGHGVPGAFMSMLGMSFLNEIIKSPDIIQPAQVLEQLRQNIIESLRQKGEEAEQFDGMDMSLVVINDDDNTIEYSGAYNPLYIISEKEIIAETDETNIKVFEEENNTKKLYEIQADKMPVAIHIKMNKFKNHVIKLNKGDQLILFSDGFADQFGGIKGKKYRYKNFKSLLLNNSDKSLDDQYEIIKEEFYTWKGDKEQIDDIAILSFKI
jgi:serine phosphatase RsbU (regulator of sigma subunit)